MRASDVIGSQPPDGNFVLTSDRAQPYWFVQTKVDANFNDRRGSEFSSEPGGASVGLVDSSCIFLGVFDTQSNTPRWTYAGDCVPAGQLISCTLELFPGLTEGEWFHFAALVGSGVTQVRVSCVPTEWQTTNEVSADVHTYEVRRTKPGLGVAEWPWDCWGLTKAEGLNASWKTINSSAVEASNAWFLR
jgi:hypothetical protein